MTPSLDININIRLSADDSITQLLANLLATRDTPTPAAPTVEPEATFLPVVDEEPKLSPYQESRMLYGDPVKPTPIPDALRNTTLHPVTQEALAAFNDPQVTQRAVGAVAERDRRVLGDRPMPVRELTPTALAKPSRTIMNKPKTEPKPKPVKVGAIQKGTLVSSERGVIDGVETLVQVIRCSCGTEYRRAHKPGLIPRCEACR